MRTRAAVGCLLVCGILICPCLFAQQPQGKPTPQPPQPSPVIVTNTDAEPVPVKVVSSPDTLGVLVDVDPSGGYVDTSQYRRVAILGMSGNGAGAGVQVAFVDNAETPTARIIVGGCGVDSTNTAYADGFKCNGPLGLVDVFNVSGPFLELRFATNLATLKVYLQK